VGFGVSRNELNFRDGPSSSREELAARVLSTLDAQDAFSSPALGTSFFCRIYLLTYNYLVFRTPFPDPDPTFQLVSDLDPDPTFQLFSDPYPDPDPVSDPTLIFSNILNINFTFVFLLFVCEIAYYDEI
jgi:hypothetical protein